MNISEYKSLHTSSGIYVLYSPATNTVKIGRATNIRKRVGQYNSTLSAWGVVPEVTVWYCGNIDHIEKEVLKQLNHLQRLTGAEYFRCENIQEVIDIVEPVVQQPEHTSQVECISNNDLRVWRCILHYHVEGLCDMRQADIAAQTNISLQTVKRSLSKLCRLKKIEKVEMQTIGYCSATGYRIIED